MSGDRITTLLEKLLSGTCTLEEKKELFTLTDSVDDPQLKAMLEQAWLSYDQPSHNLADANSQVILHNILHQNTTTKIITMRRWRIATVAAAGLLVIGLSTYWLFRSPSALPTLTNQPVVARNDVKAPIVHKATITLSNGQEIPADSIANGQLALQGKTQVIKLANGDIIYKPSGVASNVQYNTLTVPKGSQIASLMLGDGTRVWLNAGSSITYPVAFTGHERRVSIKGEAYFEVAPAGDHTIPFFVNIKNNQRDSGQVNVLGTHFNIKAYEDEADTKITLLQGSVEVSHQQRLVRIVPGQQATYTGEPEFHVNIADTDAAVAWKDGLFAYHSASIAQVLRDAARWYDIEVVYEGSVPKDTFTGDIPRTATLAEVLSILQMSRVSFRLEGKRLTVLN
jgi:transmembrane sensor